MNDTNVLWRTTLCDTIRYDDRLLLIKQRPSNSAYYYKKRIIQSTPLHFIFLLPQPETRKRGETKNKEKKSKIEWRSSIPFPTTPQTTFSFYDRLHNERRQTDRQNGCRVLLFRLQFQSSSSSPSCIYLSNLYKKIILGIEKWNSKQQNEFESTKRQWQTNQQTKAKNGRIN